MPILVIDSAGAKVWEGFTEPYGTLRGTSSGGSPDETSMSSWPS